MASSKKKRRETLLAISFLLPNMLGVLTFVIIPVAFSIFLAFSNWDLRLHNMFKSEPMEFVGLENFIRLIWGDEQTFHRFCNWITFQPVDDPEAPLIRGEFLRYLGNTLFLMMGIPFSVGGSLIAAILLSKDTRGGSRGVYLWLIFGSVLIISSIMLAVIGLGSTAMVILLTGLACGILVAGMGGGVTAYRTLFYTPHFTAGVATFLLWKKLYNPGTGPINQALQPVLDQFSAAVNAVPAGVVVNLRWLLLGLLVLLFGGGVRSLRRSWVDGELGGRAMIIPAILLCLPSLVAMIWTFPRSEAWLLIAATGLILLVHLVLMMTKGRDFTPPTNMEGVGSALVLSLGMMVGQFVLLGLAAVTESLPAMAADGLESPGWIADYHWAKPSIMIMGLWGAIGSNNMLLYLAALTNVPQELYEAADIDGAGRLQRFWHVTWPQLAPTTFFIGVMATIYGLQGGFEMARTMTQGGPAGATTTLSYFIYIEGFETGRLAFAAAVAWALFILVFSLTLFNWKFGNKYVND